jgi:hypothetical protein
MVIAPEKIYQIYKGSCGGKGHTSNLKLSCTPFAGVALSNLIESIPKAGYQFPWSQENVGRVCSNTGTPYNV